jgi:hypothetical protein
MIVTSTFEEIDRLNRAIGSKIRERNQAYLDSLGKGQTDNTVFWDTPVQLEDGRWSIQDHPYHRQAAQELGINFEEI